MGMHDIKHDEPMRIGQNFWHPARRDEGKNPNGTIIDIDREGEVVIVAFHGGEHEEYSFEVLEGTWTDKFKGGWWIE